MPLLTNETENDRRQAMAILAQVTGRRAESRDKIFKAYRTSSAGSVHTDLLEQIGDPGNARSGAGIVSFL